MSNWNPIAAVVEVVGGAYTSYQEGRTKIKTAKLDMKVAEIENRARLLRDESNNNHEWEMAQITDKDKWLRRVSYSMLTLPILISIIEPTSGALIWANLSEVPEWYRKMYLGVIAAIWGISELKNSAPALVHGLKKAIKG